MEVNNFQSNGKRIGPSFSTLYCLILGFIFRKWSCFLAYKCVCVHVCDKDIVLCRVLYMCLWVVAFYCVLLTMWEDKKPRGSQQQDQADAGQPKTSMTNNSSRIFDTANTNLTSNSRNTINPVHWWGFKILVQCVRKKEQSSVQLTATALLMTLHSVGGDEYYTFRSQLCD